MARSGSATSNGRAASSCRPPAFPEAASLPELPLDGYWKAPAATWQDIAYEEAAGSDSEFRVLQWRDECGAMSAADGGFRWACERPTGDRAARRSRLLVERHPPSNHRGGGESG